jgi:hypothetical protein
MARDKPELLVDQAEHEERRRVPRELRHRLHNPSDTPAWAWAILLGAMVVGLIGAAAVLFRSVGH